jgi:hypothetical protein
MKFLFRKTVCVRYALQALVFLLLLPRAVLYSEDASTVLIPDDQKSGLNSKDIPKIGKDIIELPTLLQTLTTSQISGIQITVNHGEVSQETALHTDVPADAPAQPAVNPNLPAKPAVIPVAPLDETFPQSASASGEVPIAPLAFSAPETVPKSPSLPPVPAPGLKVIRANPNTILSYPQSEWRNKNYEVFQWEAMMSVFDEPILIFDTASFAIQSRIMKRLAFFVERSDARGRLLTDNQLAHRIDWRAHDYQARDLAAFFHLAARSNFPLSPEELEFRDVLLDAGIIRYSTNNTFIEGRGVIISISQELPEHLRTQFIVHEGFHALFFLDEDFRAFSYRRYDNLNSHAKRLLLDYLGNLGYDTSYKFLMVNEFMGYTLQQSLASATLFFSTAILNDEKSVTGILSLFQAEAIAFSAYVNQRWGFAAGRLHILENTDALPARYTIQSGDSLSAIAARPGIYWDSRLWWLIYDANKDRIASPDAIRPDMVLNIPSSQGEIRDGAWKKDETYLDPF